MQASTNHNFHIPAFNDIHPVILAYLRTSEFGEWAVDEEKPSDAFALYLKRNEWKNKLFSIPRSSYPMRLCVTIRPLRDEVRINLRHEFDKPRREEDQEFYEKRSKDEVQKLLNYLQEFYELEQPLQIET